MGEFWATRTGRWRMALRRLETPTAVDRLYAVVRRDIEQGLLPPGLVLPAASRFAEELELAEDDVREALEQLERDAVIERADDGAYRVSSRDDPEEDGGLFKAALRRIHASGRKGHDEYGED